MNSVGVLIRMVSVVSVSGAPVPGAGPVTDHVAGELHVVAVGAHLAAIGLQVPDFRGRRPRGGSFARRRAACAPGW